MNRAFRTAGVVVAMFLGNPAAVAVQGFPPYVALPAGIDIPSPGSLTVEEFGEAEFVVSPGNSVTKKGKHFRSYLAFPGGANPGAAAAWKQFLPGLTQKGFKVVGGDGATTYTLERTAGGLDSWLSVALADFNDPLLELIETRAQTNTLTLARPAARPETFSDKDDFPYLSHLPGTALVQTAHQHEPLDVTVSGVDAEAALVGTGHLVKRYTAPSSLSRLEFAEVYREALAKAGWTVKALGPGVRPGEQAVVASYTRDGRNVWASLTRFDPSSDRGIDVAVADIGAEDWARQLERDCRLALYGIHFDFAKASLRADSEPVLKRVLTLLQDQGALAVEVQGHTDNVGGDADNQKLSDARAHAVTKWLVDHGVAAARLSAQGYGRKVPVASNDDDAGRAKNRRVELRKKGCAR